jgi:hypothetical protein
MMGILTMKNVMVIPARTSKGTMYAITGKGKAASKAVEDEAMELGGSRSPTGWWIVSQEQLQKLIKRINNGISA